MPSTKQVIDAQRAHTDRHRHIHVLLQAKGGIGKSFVARILASYLDCPLYDLDWGNHTNAQFARAIKVKKVDLRTSPDEATINPIMFDALIEEIMGEQDPHVVLDFGGAQHDALLTYITDSNALTTLKEVTESIIWFHLIICGGGGNMQDTSSKDALRIIVRYKSEPCKFVIWGNEHFGRIVNQSGEKGLTHLDTYQQIMSHTSNVHKHAVHMPTTTSMVRPDLEQLDRSKLTLPAFISSPGGSIMQKSRMKRLWGRYSEPLDVIFNPTQLAKMQEQQGVEMDTNALQQLQDIREEMDEHPENPMPRKRPKSKASAPTQEAVESEPAVEPAVALKQDTGESEPLDDAEEPLEYEMADGTDLEEGEYYDSRTGDTDVFDVDDDFSDVAYAQDEE